jgi:selenocysteine-specific elongation factor
VLDRLSQEAEERSTAGLFRLPIDRVFVMKGFGTVVTGTVVSGTLSIGESVQILPSGPEAKVRSLQVYNRPVEKTVAGQRAAVNLQGIEASAVERGDVLVHSRTLVPTQMLDVYIDYLPSAQRPLKNRTRQRFHIGTNLTSASIILLDRDEIAPGESGFAQLRLETPVVALPHDRFVIRGSGVIQTLGGGVVLDAHPARHKRNAPSVIKDLAILREGSQDQAIAQHISHSGMEGIAFDDLLKRVATSSSEVQRVIKKMIDQGEALSIDPEKMKVIDIRFYHKLREMALARLKEFHERFPMKSGLAKEELRTKLPMEVDVRLFQVLLNGLIKSGEILLEKDKLRLPTHQISTMDEKGLIRRVEEAVFKAGLQSPSPKELSEAWSEKEEGVQAVFEHLVHEGVLVKIKSGIYIHRVPFGELKEALVSYLKKNREITTPQFKEMTNASRKYAIPLIEYFDQIKLTIRLGERRVLRSSSEH